MTNLRDELEEMVDNKVEPLSTRMTALENKMQALKSKISTAEKKLKSYSDEATEVDGRAFDMIEKQLKRVNKGMKTMDVTNGDILEQGTILAKAVDILRKENILHDKLYKKLLVHGQDVVNYFKDRIEDFEDS